MALQSNDLPLILQEACRLTGQALGTDLAKILELRDDEMLLVVAGVGWDNGIVGHEMVPALERSSEGYALRTGAPAVSDNINTEDRFDYAEFLKKHGVKSMINVVIPGPDGRPPFGLLQVDSREVRDFGRHDIEFLQGYANLVGAAVERNHYQRELNEALTVQERMFASQCGTGAGRGWRRVERGQGGRDHQPDRAQPGHTDALRHARRETLAGFIEQVHQGDGTFDARNPAVAQGHTQRSPE
jgi:GAF domain-containing protein